ncbi:hypothetical protein OS493_000708 [Desmophyllum pertusum]|uniref:Uncharacterized protein n=1 Tax=Desmophyllum pertusum TaxID=174260 RepID=A0A9X0DDM0_9CNID|nr:hypothetical protein OS493_000708 [Desmophyllum pertusum]
MDIDEYNTLKDYYENAQGKTSREKLLILFCDNLRNILGGCKKETQAILHTQHVRNILDTLDPQGEDENVESLAKNGGIDVWKMWAKPQLDNSNARPGTIYAHEKWEKLLEDDETAIDPKVAEQLMDTAPAKEAIKNLQLSFSESLPSEKCFSRCAIS